MKRKVIVFCLLIALTLTAVSALAACESDPIVGTWVSEYGDTWIFEKDGTAKEISASGREWLGTWEYDTVWSTEDYPYTLYWEDGTPSQNMKINDDGTLKFGNDSYFFTKQ